jgi:hypothetical protein
MTRRQSRLFNREKWLWVATIPPTVAWAALWPGVWARWGLVYVAFQSAYALVKGAGGQEQAAKAKEAGED